MKPLLKINLIVVAGLLIMNSLSAQICSNAADTVYGLDLAGVLHGINIHTAGVSGAVGTTGPSPANLGINSNGIGYSTLNGKFYLFNRCNTGAAGDTTQFVSYDPVTHVTTVLADPPASFDKTMKIRSGAVSYLGGGYYTINPAATPNPALYYYNIAAGTWTTISTNFIDQTSTNINADISNLNSGDMTFDGSGNLWILASNQTQYALYKVKNPVPVAGPVTITCKVIIAKTNTPSQAAGAATKVSFTGLAFNSAGTMFITSGGTTGTPNAFHNVLYSLSTTAAASLTVIGSVPNDFGGDLTSCSFPTGALAETWVDFTAVYHDGIDLTWKAIEDNSVTGYAIEYSIDGMKWHDISFVNKLFSSAGSPSEYTYVDHQYAAEKNYYRIVQTAASGKQIISETKLVFAKITGRLHVGPNPVKDVMYIYNKNNASNYLAQVFDRSGRLVYYTFIEPSQQSINVGKLHDGPYLLKLTSSTNEVTSYQFIKW
jgi:hypothetical protein